MLLLGLIGCWGLKEQKYHLTVISLLLAVFLDMDYGVKGVFLVLLFYALESQPVWLAAAFGAFCVFWGQNSLILVKWGDVAIRLQTCAILALPLILYPSQKQWKLPKWFWYAVYPGHLAVLSILEKLI